MKICVFIITSFLMFCTTSFAEPEIKGTPSELLNYLRATPDTVTISATATYEAQADSAVSMISIITEDAALKKALEQNQNLRNQIIENLKKSGISPEKITGTKFSSTPKYSIFTKKPSSYKVENILKIVVGSEQEFQVVANAIDSHEEVFYRELKFEHKDKEKDRLKVLDKAIDIILKKKDLYEKKLGVLLIPKNFTDQKTPDSTYIGEAQYDNPKYAKTSFSSSATTSPIFGELIYNASLDVEYFVKKNNQ